MVKLKDADLKARQLSEDAFVAERWLRELRTRSLEIWNARQSELIEQRDAVRANVDELTARIDARRARINEADLRVYDEYRRRRPRVVAAGRALSPASPAASAKSAALPCRRWSSPVPAAAATTRSSAPPADAW